MDLEQLIRLLDNDCESIIDERSKCEKRIQKTLGVNKITSVKARRPSVSSVWEKTVSKRPSHG